MPEGIGAFKRHVDSEHGVYNKCMFDYDQLISRLKDKSVSIDVFVNSWNRKKILITEKVILAIIDAIKLCARLGIALQGHRDASNYPEIWHVPTSAGVGTFVHIINYAVRNNNKALENHFKNAVNVKLISQQLPKMIYWNVAIRLLLNVF